MDGVTQHVLDPCCGSRMFWFDRADDRAIYGDIRSEEHTLCDGRHLEVRPDQGMDFRSLPFPDGRFKLVVFDPPHLRKAGEQSWMRAKYGCLNPNTWRDDLRAGFAECFRVLEPSGVLVFKWSETQIKVSEILELTNEKPLFGHPSGKRAATHWICFMKGATSMKSTLKGTAREYGHITSGGMHCSVVGRVLPNDTRQHEESMPPLAGNLKPSQWGQPLTFQARPLKSEAGGCRW